MPTPLPLLDTPVSPADAWAGFLARRDALTARMEMATCDGCDGCGLRCMDGFTITRPERDAVVAYLATQPIEEVRRVLGQNKVAPWPGTEGETFGATVTFCRYRDMENGNCFVYPARPTVCRLFGHTDWLPCPIEAVTRIPTGGAALWGDYWTFEHRSWDEWEQIAIEEGESPKDGE